MPQTYRDVLRRLPLDAHLYRLLTRFSFFPSEDIVFSGEPSTRMSSKLSDAIDTCGDASVRTKVSAMLMRLMLLDHPSADQAMLDAVRGNADALSALAQCQSRHHRALWLHEHDAQAFDRAVQMLELGRGSSMCQRVFFEYRKPMRTDVAAREAFQDALRAFYQKERGCGDVVTVDIWERTPGVYHIAIHVKDLPQTSLEFMDKELHTRVMNPSRSIAIQYAKSTGIAEILISGGARYHKMLARAFALHLLGEDVNPEILPRPEINLEALRGGFFSQKAIDDGFSTLQVKSMIFSSPDGKVRAKLSNAERGDRTCISALSSTMTASENPSVHLWPIKAVDIKLYYTKGVKFLQQYPVLAITLRSDGSVSWAKYDDTVKGKLKEYFVEAGVMRLDQELHCDSSALGGVNGNE